jgi:glycosyltransferase involved in cell wall biosynthesis
MNPKVSIIVPVYNVEKYLSRCMDSLLNQTLRDIEIILVDDESPDNCPGMCDEYAQLDSRVRVIHKKNAGLGFARNSAIEIAIGEYIAFVDSDDYIDRRMYEILYNNAKELELDTVFCKYCRISNEGKIHLYSDDDEFQVFANENQIKGVLLDMIGTEPSYTVDRKYEMSTCTAIYSNSIINKFKIRFCSEREIISEDLFFQIDYLQNAKKIAMTDNTLYYYCINQISLSHSFREDRFERNLLLHHEIEKKLIGIFGNSRHLLRVDRMFIGYSRALILNVTNYEITLKKKKEILKKIFTNNIWKEIFLRYPYRKLPLKHYFIIICIKNKMTFLLLLLSKAVNQKNR